MPTCTACEGACDVRLLPVKFGTKYEKVFTWWIKRTKLETKKKKKLYYVVPNMYLTPINMGYSL